MINIGNLLDFCGISYTEKQLVELDKLVNELLKKLSLQQFDSNGTKQQHDSTLDSEDKSRNEDFYSETKLKPMEKFDFKSDLHYDSTIKEEILEESDIEIKEEPANDPFASLETLNNSEGVRYIVNENYNLKPGKMDNGKMILIELNEIMEKDCDSKNTTTTHPLYGSKSHILSSSRLPSRLQVINYIRFHIDRSQKNRWKKAEKAEIFRQIASDIVSKWKEACINCFDEKYVAENLLSKDIMGQMADITKTLKRITATEKSKEDTLSRLNTLFDISKCGCFLKKEKIGKKVVYHYKQREDFDYSHCSCPPKKKIVNFMTYTEQIFENDSVILLSEDEKTKYQSLLSDIERGKLQVNECNNQMDSSNLELSEQFIALILKQVDELCKNIKNGDPDLERTIKVNENLNTAVSYYRNKLSLINSKFNNVTETNCEVDFLEGLLPHSDDESLLENESADLDYNPIFENESEDLDYNPKVTKGKKKKKMSNKKNAIRNVICKICFLDCKSNEKLKTHQLKKHMSGNQKICNYCDKLFETWHLLRLHIESKHPKHGEKNNICTVCGKGFIFLESCKLHETKHKTFPCQFCGKQLTSKYALEDHLSSTHNFEADQHVCELCGFSTLSKKLFGKHKLEKHNPKSQRKCPHCDYQSPKIERLHVHMDSKHPNHDKKTFSCDHCSRTFIFADSLKKHHDNIRTMQREKTKKGIVKKNLA